MPSSNPLEDLRPMNQVASHHDLARERDARFAVVDEVRQAFLGVPNDEIERETDRIIGEEERETSDGQLPSER